jgi:hypothetical protein
MERKEHLRPTPGNPSVVYPSCPHRREPQARDHCTLKPPSSRAGKSSNPCPKPVKEATENPLTSSEEITKSSEEDKSVFFDISEPVVVDNTDTEPTEPTAKTPSDSLASSFGSPANRFPHYPPGFDKLSGSLVASMHAKILNAIVLLEHVMNIDFDIFLLRHFLQVVALYKSIVSDRFGFNYHNFRFVSVNNHTRTRVEILEDL